MTDLKITQQQLENQQLLLTIEVPDQRVEKAMRAAAKKLARQYRIPGFRPGKAPYHVIVSRFGREALLADVADEMGQDIFQEALDAAVHEQERLIETAAGYLRPGGRLLYSTCSIEPEENSRLVASFLRRHRGFTLVEEELSLPDAGRDGGYVALIEAAGQNGHGRAPQQGREPEQGE